MKLSYKKLGALIDKAQEEIEQHSAGEFEFVVSISPSVVIAEVRVVGRGFCPYTWMSCRDILDEKAMRIACNAAVKVSAGYKL